MPLRGQGLLPEFLGQGLLPPPARNTHLLTDTKIDLKNLDHVMSPMYLQILFVDGGATALSIPHLQLSFSHLDAILP